MFQDSSSSVRQHTLFSSSSSSINTPQFLLCRAFLRAEAQRHRLMVEERRSQYAASGFCYLLGNNTSNRYEDGYLIREFPIKSLYVEEATPPVDELQAFNQVRS